MAHPAVRPMLPSVRRLLAGECGAVTVDYVVLVSGAAMLAAGLAAAYTNQLLQLNYNVAANVQERDTRPSFAYRPYDEGVHSTFATLFSTLTDGELSELSAWGNAKRSVPPAGTQDELETFRDLDNAITAVYGSRYKSRGDGDDYDAATLERIVAKLGLANASLPD